MAAITPTLKSSPVPGGTALQYFGTGTANQADTMTSPIAQEGSAQRVISVGVAYSAAPTHTGVIITLDSGRGAGYDKTLWTGNADVRYTVYIPDEVLWLFPGDAILVNVPAGSGVITAAVNIDLEQH